jgi:type IV pilus assembly protein PilE
VIQKTNCRQTGFTLIELMVTLAIAAIVAMIAIPSYQSQVRKSRRTEARMAVLDLASREERFLSTANNYTQTGTDVGYAAFPVPSVGSGYYSLNVVTPDPTFVANGGTTPSYIITATAIGQQVKDTACQTFSVNQLGTQSATDSTGAAAPGCWN